ncbi:MAG: hypothetical protein MJ252_00100 [archaeon]|nr:hypothetical protein [archaeon]
MENTTINQPNQENKLSPKSLFKLQPAEEENVQQPIIRLKKKRMRLTNSLGELTKNFLDYIINKGEEKIDLNEAVKQMKVKKRRIYDITNVLEGIGYIKRIKKGKIKWIKKGLIPTKGNKNNSQENTPKKEKENKTGNENPQESNEEYPKLVMENKMLEHYISQMEENIRNISEDPDNKNFLYVTSEDLQEIAKDDKINIIAIKTPPGATVEVPDRESAKEMWENLSKTVLTEKEKKSIMEDMSMDNQMFVEAETGKLSLYLITPNSEYQEIASKVNSEVQSNFCFGQFQMAKEDSKELSRNNVQNKYDNNNSGTHGFINSVPDISNKNK